MTKAKNTLPVILFEYGSSTGGAIVYRLHNNKVVEKGSSGGITGEDGDPIREWESEYDNWETWWQGFTNKHKEYWIWFYPVIIHEELKDFIKQAVDNYQFKVDNFDFYKKHWLTCLNH